MQSIPAAPADPAIPARSVGNPPWSPSLHPPLPELIDRYLAYCQARRLAPATIRKYADALRVFRGNDAMPAPADLEARLAGIQGSPWTARTTWQVWTSFFRWATRRHDVRDPMLDLAPPRIHQAARRVFTLGEVRKLWDAASSTRDKALILVAMDTGARLGEIAALRKADVGRDTLNLNSGLGDRPGCRHCELERGRRAVGGKSGPRRVPVLESTADLLRSLGDSYHIWLSEPEGKDSRNRALAALSAEGLGPTAIARELERLGYGRISETMVRDVLRRRPSPKTVHPLTREGVREVFKRLADRAGLTGPKVGPHSFRHLFATTYLSRGGPLAKLQRYLGHKSPETTMIYAHLVIDDLRRDHARYSPALQLGNVRALIRPRDWRRPASQWNGVKAYVFRRDGRRCAECGTTEDLSLDHVMPRSAGGVNAVGNGQVLCRPCNERKGARVTV